MNSTHPDFANCALITIDLQNDTLPGQPMEVHGTNEVIPAVLRLLNTFRSNKLPIVHLVRIYNSDGKNVDLCRRQQVLDGHQLFISGSKGADMIPALFSEAITLNAHLLLNGGVQKIGKTECIIYKPRWGGFYNTPLENVLRAKGITTLIFTGCNFPNCPRTTIYEASERDFRLVMVTDAISGIYDKGIQELNNIGVSNFTTEELINAIIYC